jgi:Probable Zinc-ribbon domain
VSSAGCPFCQRREACAGNNLRATHPHLVADWDAAGDAALGLTLDNVLYSLNKRVSWLCPNGHDPYVAQVRQRSMYNKGCSVRTKAVTVERRRATIAARRRQQAALADEGWARLEAERRDAPFG